MTPLKPAPTMAMVNGSATTRLLGQCVPRTTRASFPQCDRVSTAFCGAKRAVRQRDEYITSPIAPCSFQDAPTRVGPLRRGVGTAESERRARGVGRVSRFETSAAQQQQQG